MCPKPQKYTNNVMQKKLKIKNIGKYLEKKF
jgi:hypothetical protein